MASLASPSPSITTMVRRGMPSRRAIAIGATSSGGEMIAPSTKPIDQSQSEHEMHDGGDRDGGEGHAAEGEQADGADVVAELAPAHGDAGGVDQRRHHEQEHELRRKLDPRQSRHQRDQKPGHHQEDGGRNAGAVRRDRDDRDGDENEDQDGIGLHGLTERGVFGTASERSRRLRRCRRPAVNPDEWLDLAVALELVAECRADFAPVLLPPRRLPLPATRHSINSLRDGTPDALCAAHGAGDPRHARGDRRVAPRRHVRRRPRRGALSRPRPAAGGVRARDHGERCTRSRRAIPASIRRCRFSAPAPITISARRSSIT